MKTQIKSKKSRIILNKDQSPENMANLLTQLLTTALEQMMGKKATKDPKNKKDKKAKKEKGGKGGKGKQNKNRNNKEESDDSQ